MTSPEGMPGYRRSSRLPAVSCVGRNPPGYTLSRASHTARRAEEATASSHHNPRSPGSACGMRSPMPAMLCNRPTGQNAAHIILAALNEPAARYDDPRHRLLGRTRSRPRNAGVMEPCSRAIEEPRKLAHRDGEVPGRVVKPLYPSTSTPRIAASRLSSGGASMPNTCARGTLQPFRVMLDARSSTARR